jgi:hypothetical protein
MATKPCEHFQSDMAGQHVGEQTHAVRDRSQEERQNLDEHDQRQDVARNALRHEEREELQPVLVDAVDQDGEEHQKRQRRGDDDVARDREGVGNDPHQVRDADEHEEREDQREELHAFRAGGSCGSCWRRTRRDLRDRLHRPGTSCLPARQHQEPVIPTAHEHVDGRIGDGDRVLADMAEREDGLDVELMNRVDFHPREPWSAGISPAIELQMS